MSKLSDYSKFDHIDSDEDENDDGTGPIPKQQNNPTQLPAMTTPKLSQGTTKKSTTAKDRYVFEFNGQKIYEWEQSLEEVTVYIDAPPHVTSASFLVVNIFANKLQVGLKGGDRFFIDEKTFDKVKVKESSWFLDEGVITIVLAKCFRGQTWEGVLCGASLLGNGNETGERVTERIDPFTKQEMQRTLMLERFQEENPGFDFRDATFNGEVPDPKTFMGGVGYNH